MSRRQWLPRAARERTRSAPHCAIGLLVACAATAAAGDAAAQTPTAPLSVLRIEATPVGALPPLSLPMPASRDHHYWGGRVHWGGRFGRNGDALHAIGGGIDLQWRGGSVFGATLGYQARDCAVVVESCGGHALLGARARFGLITGGPTLASLVGSHSGTTTVGVQTGIGFAPDFLPGENACTVDLGVPLSIAMLQRVRLVTYLTPAVVWDFDCFARADAVQSSYLLNAGIGLQQFGGRGLDVYLGVQRIFRGAPGYLIGLSVTYVRLP